MEARTASLLASGVQEAAEMAARSVLDTEQGRRRVEAEQADEDKTTKEALRRAQTPELRPLLAQRFRNGTSGIYSGTNIL